MPCARLTEFQMMRDRGLIVGGERKNERAFAAQFDIDAGCTLKLLTSKPIGKHSLRHPI
jgi:hypothetical protein